MQYILPGQATHLQGLEATELQRGAEGTFPRGSELPVLPAHPHPLAQLLPGAGTTLSTEAASHSTKKVGSGGRQAWRGTPAPPLPRGDLGDAQILLRSVFICSEGWWSLHPSPL